jgi:hypothetical protein
METTEGKWDYMLAKLALLDTLITDRIITPWLDLQYAGAVKDAEKSPSASCLKRKTKAGLQAGVYAGDVGAVKYNIRKYNYYNLIQLTIFW